MGRQVTSVEERMAMGRMENVCWEQQGTRWAEPAPAPGPALTSAQRCPRSEPCLTW